MPQHAARIAAQTAVADALGGTARALYNLGQTTEGADKRIQEHAESARKAAEDISVAAAETVERLKAIGGGAGDIAGETFPAKTPEEVAAAKGSAALAALKETKEYKANEAAIARKERHAEQAWLTGMIEEGTRLGEEATAMRVALNEAVNKILEDNIVTKKELQRMNTLLRRVVRARA